MSVNDGNERIIGVPISRKRYILFVNYCVQMVYGNCHQPLSPKDKQTMILTRDEIAFLDVYCHEGTEPPYGGPATDALRKIGVGNVDILNLQWAYLREQPPTAPVIGSASEVAPRLPWANRQVVLRRDADIQAIREETQRARVPHQP